MTDQERRESIISELCHDYISYSNLHDDDKQGCRVIREALVRDNKVKVVLDNYEGHIGKKCPICNTQAWFYQKYCFECGQKLDWSDVE